MESSFTRLAHDLANDLSGRGPLRFRLVLQPAAAVFFAVRAALRDAREGRPAFFFLSALIDPAHRRAVFRETWEDVGKVFVTAAVVDVIYQLIVQHRVYPLQALIVAVILAVLPYLLIRGPLTRIVEYLQQRAGGSR